MSWIKDKKSTSIPFFHCVWKLWLEIWFKFSLVDFKFLATKDQMFLALQLWEPRRGGDLQREHGAKRKKTPTPTLTYHQ